MLSAPTRQHASATQAELSVESGSTRIAADPDARSRRIGFRRPLAAEQSVTRGVGW